MRDSVLVADPGRNAVHSEPRLCDSYHVSGWRYSFVGCVILVLASCSSGSKTVAPTTTTTTSSTPNPRVYVGGRTGSTPESTAELRGIYASALPQGEPEGVSCSNLGTKEGAQVPRPNLVDFNSTRTTCYLLGPELATPANIVGASVVRIHAAPIGLVWAVDVRLDRVDLFRGPAEGFMGHNIAVVVDGVVRWTPTLGGGRNSAVLFSQFAEVPAQYTRAEAITIAASIAGIAPSQVRVYPKTRADRLALRDGVSGRPWTGIGLRKKVIRCDDGDGRC